MKEVWLQPWEEKPIAQDDAESFTFILKFFLHVSEKVFYKNPLQSNIKCQVASTTEATKYFIFLILIT